MTVTYVYCVLDSARPPSLAGVPRGLPGLGRPRALHIDGRLYAIVADAPVKRYTEAAINRGLADLDWVSRAAVAHESVIEHFTGARAVLPLKLFTIFTDDERACEQLRGDRRRLASAARRVANHQEWGVRLALDASHAAASRRTAQAVRTNRASGAAYLSRKKAQRDAVLELTARSRQTATDLFEKLAAAATDALRRGATESTEGGSLLLDAAFLVRRGRARAFRALAAKQARAMSPAGYRLALTGPWPPYSFV